jgi:hypothetical protein
MCYFQGQYFITIITKELVLNLEIHGFIKSPSGCEESLPGYIEPWLVRYHDTDYWTDWSVFLWVRHWPKMKSEM